MIINSADGIRWDLTDLFSSHDDSRIEEIPNECFERARKLSDRYRGTIHAPSSPEPQHLLQALTELEEIEETASLISHYSGLLDAEDSLKPEYQNLEQGVEQRIGEIHDLFLFFALERMERGDEEAEGLMGQSNLSVYHHYLKNLRRYRPHKLSEPEEKIANEKDNTGKKAFTRLFSETTSALTFAVEKEGKFKELEVLSLLHRSDHNLRKQAWRFSTGSYPTIGVKQNGVSLS